MYITLHIIYTPHVRFDSVTIFHNQIINLYQYASHMRLIFARHVVMQTPIPDTCAGSRDLIPLHVRSWIAGLYDTVDQWGTRSRQLISGVTLKLTLSLVAERFWAVCSVSVFLVGWCWTQPLCSGNHLERHGRPDKTAFIFSNLKFVIYVCNIECL